MRKVIIIILLVSAEFVTARTLQGDAVTRFTFDEIAGDIPSDQITKNNQCVPFPNTQILHNGVEDEQRGFVVRFDTQKRGTEYASINSIRTNLPIPIEGSAERSISFWFKSDLYYEDGETPQNVAHLMLMGNDGQPADSNNRSKFLVALRNNGQDLRVTNGGNLYYIDFLGSKDLRGEWHHVAITVAEDGCSSGIRCYVDGEEYDNRRINSPDDSNYNLNTSRSTITFGLAYRGALSDFQLFDVELSKEDIAQLYRQ